MRGIFILSSPCPVRQLKRVQRKSKSSKRVRHIYQIYLYYLNKIKLFINYFQFVNSFYVFRGELQSFQHLFANQINTPVILNSTEKSQKSVWYVYLSKVKLDEVLPSRTQARDFFNSDTKSLRRHNFIIATVSL